MMPSPMNLSTVPFSSEIARETCSKYTDICSSNASGVDCSACVEKFSRSENRMLRLRFSTPRASGMPDLISPLTTSTGAKEENDRSELRSSEAAD